MEKQRSYPEGTNTLNLDKHQPNDNGFCRFCGKDMVGPEQRLFEEQLKTTREW